MSHKTVTLPPGFELEEDLSPAEVIQWAVETFGTRLFLTTAFGLNGVALIHMVHAIEPSLPAIFIDTGYHFPETLETKRRVVERYGLNLIEYRVPRSVEEEDLRAGRASFLENPELCCAKRKVEVFQRALADLQPAALISARSRFQSETRSNLPVVELGTNPVHVNPLARWSLEEVERFVRENRIPYNPLHDQGYLSIGCWPCTQPVAPGDEVRAGRWAGTEKKECGIWVDGDTVRRAGR